MSMIESIASYSTSISMSNAKQDVSIKLLKNMMKQSEENMMKLMEMVDIPQISNGSTIDYKI